MVFILHTLAGLALAVTAVSAQSRESDATIPFAQEPEFFDGPDAIIPFVDEPGFTHAAATRNMDFGNLENRQLLLGAAIAGFQIASAVAPIIAGFIETTKKECQQLACWIGTSDRTCGISVAERVQNEVTKGRDRYRIESIADNGLWVRYWRTQFEPIDRGDIAMGNCTNGAQFTVSNCQSTGEVYC